jgi:hypothetical protein
MNNIDTNIDNYSLEDMVNLFKISTNLTDDNIIDMTIKMKKIKDISDPDHQTIIILFKQISMILSCIHKYRDYMKINDTHYLPSKEDDNYIISLIKNYHNFENIDNANILLTKILDKIEKEDELNDDIIDVKSLTPAQPLVFDKSNTSIVNTFENKVVSGTINSIKRITNLVNVHIDSCFREKYYNSNPCNYVYVLPKQFKNVISMKLASIEIPNSWYLFSHLKKNNMFTIEITTCNVCSIYNIIIPDGNYDTDTIIAYLNNKYFNQSNSDLPLRHLMISINPNNNKTQFEIVETAPDDLVFSLHFTTDITSNMMETFGWILGFRLSRYLKIEGMLSSEGLFDAGGDRYIYLCVNDYQYNYNETNIICFDKSSIDQYTLAKISLINGKFSLIIAENDSNPLVKIRQYNGPVNLTKMEIKLLDKFGNVIDLNFMDFSFSLELELLYERNNII